MPKRINLFGPINPTGYGVHFTNFAMALKAIDYDPIIFPIGEPMFTVPGSQEALLPCIQRQGEFDAEVPSIKLWHAIDMATFSGKPRIGYTVFELNRLNNSHEVNHMESCDKVWVPSLWAEH